MLVLCFRSYFLGCTIVHDCTFTSLKFTSHIHFRDCSHDYSRIWPLTGEETIVACGEGFRLKNDRYHLKASALIFCYENVILAPQWEY